MSDHFEHNANDHEDPDAGSTWTVGFVGAFLVPATMLGVAALTYSIIDEHRAAMAEEAGPVVTEVDALRTAQTTRLQADPHRELRPENLDGSESLVIPLSEAIELYVAEASTAQKANR